jgi:acyl-coenzyme A synthetase/AMP-(fatty) acid ligase|tara:strand:+ start:3277 stop:4047 length:771 start_codon:yes stop_codon:yes gene_type:complete
MIRQFYDKYDNNYFDDVIENGKIIYTSGTSGEPKAIKQTPSKIAIDAKNACYVQRITNSSVIYTCLDPERAGGLFAQTIPALSVGATVDLVRFNPYDYVRNIAKYTHSHLTPKQAKAVVKTKTFKTLDLKGHVFLVGSEPVTYDIIEAFVERGCEVILIWGMTEIGPNAIMHRFTNMDEVEYAKSITPPNTTILGDIINCSWISVGDGNLFVEGDICVFDDWYDTKDKVVFDAKHGIFFYKGRDGTTVDFNRPRKG